MKKLPVLCAALAALCLLSACQRDSSSDPPPIDAPPPAVILTQEEGAAVLEKLLGKVDTATGNPMSYGYESAVTQEGISYYNYRVSWLVDDNHMSYLTNYLVSLDGSLVREYLSAADAALQAAADAVLQRMQAADFAALADWVDPEKGVTFTPYSTVDATADRRLSAAELAEFGEDTAIYTWGTLDGSGLPIELSNQDYWARFVWNTDYTAAPDVTLQGVAQTGNMPENVDEAYSANPDEGGDSFSYIEYHFDGLDPQYGGIDWCALKLVFVRRGDDWKLVGLIHSQNTV